MKTTDNKSYMQLPTHSLATGKYNRCRCGGLKKECSKRCKNCFTKKVRGKLAGRKIW